MVRFLFFITICQVLCGCYRNVDGYRVNAFHTHEILWEHPVDLNSDEEQIIDVPFIKFGHYFSLCFDREPLPDRDLYLKHDSLEISFHIADSVFFGEPIASSLQDYGCPINGRFLMPVHVPQGFNPEKGGQLRFRVRKRHYLKNIQNARIVLAWGHPGAK
ncbi:hypothetical protein [Fibrobacter succinogenes]|uniref:hypothetical protein n=1 Tax=Fibrobacter succinogenes TaxID=833 RepID=UPI001568B8F0|nr:hypothetical protein [Fibrobacter succinogenes]